MSDCPGDDLHDIRDDALELEAEVERLNEKLAESNAGWQDAETRCAVAESYVCVLREELEELHNNLNHTMTERGAGCFCHTGDVLARTEKMVAERDARMRIKVFDEIREAAERLGKT